MIPRSFQKPSWPLLVALVLLWGRSLLALEALLVRLGPLQADLRASGGDLGALLGRHRGDLGASWGDLGPILERLGVIWGPLGVILRLLGRSWVGLGVSWGDLGGVL